MRDKLPHKVKAECHRLMKFIWGDNNHLAYAWLHKNTDIKHFGEENNYLKLFNARKKLQSYALQKRLIEIEDLINI